MTKMVSAFIVILTGIPELQLLYDLPIGPFEFYSSNKS